MKIRPLIIDNNIQSEIKCMIEYAHNNIITMHDIMRIMSNPDKAAGNDPKRRMVIPVGYLVAYSIEQQPCGNCHHISISVIDEDKRCLPSAEAFGMIANEFGIKNIMQTWAEGLDDGSRAINAIALVESI